MDQRPLAKLYTCEVGREIGRSRTPQPPFGEKSLTYLHIPCTSYIFRQRFFGTCPKRNYMLLWQERHARFMESEESEAVSRLHLPYLEQLNEEEKFQLLNTQSVVRLLNELPDEKRIPLQNRLADLSTSDQTMPSVQRALRQTRDEIICAYYLKQGKKVRFLDQVDPQGNTVPNPSPLVFPLAIASNRKRR